MSNADRAARVVLEFWGEGHRELPMILGVPADPACHRDLGGGRFSPGFVNRESGRCVGGLTVSGVGIFLLLHPSLAYHHALPHELQHWLRGDGDHRARGVWEPPTGESDTNLVPRAQAWLRMWPEVDAMVVQP